MATNNELTFYLEWIELDKKEFRILAMLSDKGTFEGTLADICRYLGLSIQQRNRVKITESINKLADRRFIRSQTQGRQLHLSVIPQITKIHVPRDAYERIQTHNYSSRSVSWEATLKVLLWLTNRRGVLHTDRDIAEAINMSVDAVSDAKHVLEAEIKNIYREVSRANVDGIWYRIGQRIDVNAWCEE